MRKGKETLMADQMIFKRCEIKYMLDITQAELLKNSNETVYDRRRAWSEYNMQSLL